ncbi:hypothetical protein DFP72DRAFT_1127531 [Ephemerocybe angulata]|uniref:Uncharacterized protein n=1 Tax=Ephemerocybe angulata TaxID=980116 RepID=A0A8H6HVX2_9AGAR|nr:hypothetical protein DFP72DRAFT_1127531 [Tulosesus angulatus]
MAQFISDFWLPAPNVFALNVVDHSNMDRLYYGDTHPIDYIVAAGICIILLAMQGCAVFNMMGVWRGSRARSTDHRHRPKPSPQEIVLYSTNGILALLFASAMALYAAAFATRLWSLGYISPRTGVDNPGSEAPTQSTAAGSFLDCGKVFCFAFTPKYPQWEVALTCIFQILLHLSDLLLVYRCYVVFQDRVWVYVLPLVPFVTSVGMSIYGLVVLIRITTTHDVVATYLSVFKGDDPDTILKSFNRLTSASIFVTVISSVLVNVFVTISIILRVFITRWRVGKIIISGLHHGDSERTPGASVDVVEGLHPSLTRCGEGVYSTVSTLLVESAAPSAVFGLIACFTTNPYNGSHHPMARARFSMRILWIGFTALAPQWIWIKVARNREVHAAQSNEGGQSSHLHFAQDEDPNVPVGMEEISA